MRRGRRALAFGALALLLPLTAARYPSQGEAEACSPNKPLIPDAPLAFADLGIPQAWKFSTGAEVTVAVIDTGIARGNAHFPDGAVLAGMDLTAKRPGKVEVDLDGHGTYMAGIIAARPVQGSGVVGVAKSATLLPIRIYTSAEDTRKEPPGAMSERIAEGIEMATKEGAKIISVSFSTEPSARLANAVADARRKGSLVVASAGNADPNGKEGNAPHYPAAYPGALGVSAVDIHGEPANTVVHNSTVKIVAPGQRVYSASKDVTDCAFNFAGPQASPATAYVAGIAALVASAYPNETPDEWEYRLLATASRPNPSLQTATMGWGIVAPVAALSYISDGKAPGPPHPKGIKQLTQQGGTRVTTPVKDRPDVAARVPWLVGVGVVTAGALTAIVLARRLLRG